MYAETKAVLAFSLMTASSVFVIVDPFATVPAFVVLTEHDSAVKRAPHGVPGGLALFSLLRGEIGIRVLGRLMGLVLVAIAVQFATGRLSVKAAGDRRRTGIHRMEKTVRRPCYATRIVSRCSGAPAIDTPPDSILQAADRAIDHSNKVISCLKNHDGAGASHIGGDLAPLIDAAPRTVHVR